MEDGNQSRDLIYVSDAVRACCLAMESPLTAGEIINADSGIPTTIKSLAAIVEEFQHSGEHIPIITGEYRENDVRCCFAAVSKAKKLLNYQQEVSLKQGILRLLSSFENPSLLKSFKNLSL